MLRSAILAAARNERVEHLVSTAPLSRSVVRRFVGGADTESAVNAARALVAGGLTVTLDHLGEDTTDEAHAQAVTDAYLAILTQLHRAGLADMIGPLTAQVEVSVKLSAVGQALPGDGHKIALEHARRICTAARAVSATVTLDMEEQTTTDSTLTVLGELRADFPETGAVLQAYLHRTEADCRELAGLGSRVRLCKGAYNEPASVAYRSRSDVDRSYVRCVNVLLEGQGYPMFATHDPRLISIIAERASHHGRSAGDFEYQFLYGIRPDEQRRLCGAGETVRVYVPYGEAWYGYLMRRLAERPANLVFFARSLISKG
ncbi:MAG: proline dehydrogenase family protein [Actinomycetota bacterium]